MNLVRNMTLGDGKTAPVGLRETAVEQLGKDTAEMCVTRYTESWANSEKPIVGLSGL